MSGDPPVLSSVVYDELVVDRRLGPFEETVSADTAAALAAEIGKPQPVEQAPPAVFPILFLKALRRALGGIPPGSILAKQELEFHRVLPVDSTVAIETWIGNKEVKRERPFVTIEFEIRDAAGELILSGRKIIIWPTGPGEEAPQ